MNENGTLFSFASEAILILDAVCVQVCPRMRETFKSYQWSND